MDDPEREHDRRRARFRLRRHHMRRRRRERRLGAAAIGAVGLVALLASWGDGKHPIGASQDQVGAQVPALEANRRADAQERQDQALHDVLGYTEFLRHGEPREPEVAITFDDGPSVYTDDILRVLRRRDAPATFFVLGNMVAARPALVRRELRQGHAVGAHTYDHPHLGQLTPAAQAQELTDLDDVMEAHHLPVPSLFRPPYGSFDSETLRLLDEREALMVLWSVDTGDYENPGWDVIAQRALEGAEPGAVILLHDGGGDRAQTLVALPLILKGLRKRGLRPVTVPQLLVDDPPPRGQSIERATAVEPPGAGLPSD